MSATGPGADSAYAARRVSYAADTLAEADLAAHPLGQFEHWYADAVTALLSEPNAMVLASVDSAGSPSARTVLLKAADARGFVFYTNYASRKAREIAEHTGAVALCFPWHGMQRQVAVRGVARRVPAAETAAYFATRPWGSRIGAWASHQSQPLQERATLEEQWADLARRWPDRGDPGDVPVPGHWGGFVVRAWEVEFWQGRPSRLHDRLVYRSLSGEPRDLDDAAAWQVERRQP